MNVSTFVGSANSDVTSSELMFVRSQSQLAVDNPAAKGHRLTRIQAEHAFGIELIERVLDEDVVSLVPSFHEPANTLRRKREQLGLSVKQVAKYAHLNERLVNDAETPGKIVPIQALNELCQVLALNEEFLGYRPTAGSDDQLGIRLRMLVEEVGEKALRPSVVKALVEAAWVISKQMSLSELIEKQLHPIAAQNHPRDSNYSFPTYEKGYLLAEKTRQLLDLDPLAPIESIRVLVEDTLGIPLIQVALENNLAGATIANGPYRGIVVNEKGRNSEVAVRRMTICHELAHLIWDPDERLDRLRVDDYKTIVGASHITDVVEMRANSFAVSFLAPRAAVKQIVTKSASINAALEEVSHHFGISPSAARYHVSNVMKIETGSIKTEPIDFSTWISAENQTVDYLPGLEEAVPISRKGMFSGIVAQAFLDHCISADTAAMCLKTSAERISTAAAGIADIWRVGRDSN